MTAPRRHALTRLAAVALAVALALPLAGCGLSLLPRRGMQAPPAATAKAEPKKSKRASAASKVAKPVGDARVARANPARRSAGAESAPRDPMAELRARAAAEPNEPYWPYALAVRHAAADSGWAAEAALRQALARDPDHAPSLALLSRQWFAAGRHAEALHLLGAARERAASRGAALEPVLLAAFALHADALGRGADADAAIAAVPRERRHDVAPVAAYLALRAGAPADSARELVSDAVREDGRSAANRNNEGIARLRAGDPKHARKAFLEAIERDPRLPGPYYNLAILEKFYLFDDVAAARWFRQYRERSSEDPDGLAQVMDDVQAPAEKGGR